MSSYSDPMFAKLRFVAKARRQSLVAVANGFSVANRKCLAENDHGSRPPGRLKVRPSAVSDLGPVDPFPGRDDLAVVTGTISFRAAQADLVIDKLEKLRPGERFNIFVSSPGGNLEEGLRVYHALKAARGDVHAHIHGQASSAASIIAIGASRRTMEPDAIMLIHNPRLTGAASGAPTAGLAYWIDRLADLYARETRLSFASARDLMRRETILTAQEALRAGFVHAIELADGTLVDDPRETAAHNFFGGNDDRFADELAAVEFDPDDC
jgi:ATP-dependent protease ClpP protease subunit